MVVKYIGCWMSKVSMWVFGMEEMLNIGYVIVI